MENASKALIIAGAILISILLISVGIMIFNSSSGLFNSATSKMSDQEKQLFNSTFTMYEGKRVSGSSVKELIRAIISSNTDDENPDVKVNDSEPTSADKIGEETVKNAYQYTVKCEDTDKDGVIDKVNISKTTTSSGS